MGSAIANVLSDNKQHHYPINDVIIYGIDEQELTNLSLGHNRKYFPKISLHKFKVTNNLQLALQNKQYIILAIPSIVIGNLLTKISNQIDKKTIVINLAKGFDLELQTPIHEIIMQKLPHVQGVVSLIGPSHAEEIVTRNLTVINAVSKNYELNKKVMQLFSNNYLFIKSELDVIGANVCAFYKNIIAIASGMIDALSNSVNTRAALLTAGLQEMALFTKAMGGNETTVWGLNGVGDLFVTATSRLSRNYNFGFTYWQKIAKNKKNTIEGINACKVVYNLARTQNLKLPIVNILYKILFLNQKFDLSIWKKVFE